MSIYDIFSKRQKKLRGEIPDVYIYDNTPIPLRRQIVHIWNDVIYYLHEDEEMYDPVVNILRREYGEFRLPSPSLVRSTKEELLAFFLNQQDNNKVLDVVEVSFQVLSYSVTRRDASLSKTIVAAIDEMNQRFKEHGIGYQFTDGLVIRMDSEYIHSEVVRPALNILQKKQFSGARQEFLSAHKHYRNGETKEALNECLKAFESIMKAICDKRKWNYDHSTTARDLIDVCFQNQLVPQFWQSNYNALRSLLESSVPTGRNKLSGHGQGTTPRIVPEHIAGYMLHMTAAAIVFLGESDAQMV